MMNKRGQLGLTIISIIFFWIIAFGCINFIMPEVTTASAALNCDSTTISGGNMFLCLITDLTVIYFIITIISVVLGSLTARLLL
jgi:hypothetical protein